MATGSLTGRGFTIPTYQEIIKDNGDAISVAVGLPLDLSPDSPIGAMNRTFGSTTFNLYELLQAIYNARDISKAEGTQLDALGVYAGVTRIAPQPATGYLTLFTQNNQTIPSGYTYQATSGVNTYNLTTNSSVLSISGDNNNQNKRYVNAVVIKLLAAGVGVDLGLYINSELITYTTTGTDLQGQIEGLRDEINSQIIDPDDGYIASVTGDKLLIQTYTNNVVDYFKNGLNVDLINEINLSIYGNSINLLSQTEDIGASVTVPANSVVDSLENINETLFVSNTEYRPPVFGNNSKNGVIVNDFASGQDAESDEAYRARLLGVDTEATTTFGNIVSEINNVTGVSSVSIIENETWLNKVEAALTLPPHSFSPIVNGGEDNAIAQAIWDSKPISVPSVGNSSGVAVDVFGNEHAVSFSRPESLFVGLTVKINVGEDAGDLTASMIENIQNALKAYGDTLGIGSDIIPTSFNKIVYQTIPEASWVSISGAVNSSTPVPMPSPSVCRIPVGSYQEPTFLTSNITVTWEACP